MPHLVILYSGNLEAVADMSQLCRALADTMLAVKDEEGKQVFPTGGTRVLAYPSAHHAVYARASIDRPAASSSAASSAELARIGARR